MRLVKTAEIQEMDRLTIHKMGIPGAVLMENAARGSVRMFLGHFDPSPGSCAVVICGPGNNGGDGYAMSRYLSHAGMRIIVLVLAKAARITGDALINLKIIKRMKMDIREAPGPAEWRKTRGCLADCDYIIDGILGTGLNSDVSGYYSQVIREVNSSGKPVMSIDIPSGLNADTGKVMGAAIRADLTVTFGFPKLGQMLFPGADLVGRLARIDIGIPYMVAEMVTGQCSMLEPDDFVGLLRDKRRDIHKGDRGHLFILAGSTGKTGAATLAAMGALRAGAGLVTLGIPGSLNSILEAKLTEAMTVPLPETGEGTLSLKAKGEIFRLLEGKDALAIGPGLSTNPETSALVKEIVAGCGLPMVIDADGLNALAGDRRAMKALDDRKILTPHPGEMGRLMGLNAAEVQDDRVGAASVFSKTRGCYLVLKGARTLIAGPGGEVYLNPTGNPALSSGGAGDVLTGLISGLLARGWPMIGAANAGVYLHGLAADLLAEDMGGAGVLAGEFPDIIPGLMDALSRNEWPLEGLPPHFDLYQQL
jgi:ADP-dependent NAD(P)H-hydrate dehydratase / NAD(P)H-hydrate epimerase